MRERVDVKSFESVELFRAAVLRFIDSANAALTSADVEITHTINWLESEQIPYWKGLLRSSADEIEKLKTAYRDKAFYKDATGARHSAIDELKALRRAEARREEIEQRAAATRRNLRQLQRELTLYKGAASQLRTIVNGNLGNAVEELRQVVEQLERYVHVAPEAPRPLERAADMAREDAIVQLPEPTPEQVDEAALIESLRRRTPAAKVRKAAERADFMPGLPEAPDPASLGELPLAEAGPGRYDLLTTTLGSDAEGGDVYLERMEPVGPADTGWHMGPAGQESGRPACVTITAGRIASQQPGLHRLLSLPVGWMLRCEGGRLAAIVDPLGRSVWRAGEKAMEG